MTMNEENACGIFVGHKHHKWYGGYYNDGNFFLQKPDCT